ncbi:MAG: hypothetical protein KGL48_01525 [Sphingomonadales bacterium]|nr:hypothetical protein [Sphingomonadales bacterium]MDE2569386.1 hypothetical protein [Sphingomonadales bacterium]
MKRVLALLGLAAGLLAGPVLARDSLGVFGSWAAFRDAGVPRCYAIAAPEPSSDKRDFQPYASVGIWPRRGVRGQVYFRLSRRLAAHSPAHLAVGGRHFDLAAGQAGAWAPDANADAGIVAAMRSASTMMITARAADGRLFRDLYQLDGAASALDAAALGCAGN